MSCVAGWHGAANFLWVLKYSLLPIKIVILISRELLGFDLKGQNLTEFRPFRFGSEIILNRSKKFVPIWILSPAEHVNQPTKHLPRYSQCMFQSSTAHILFMPTAMSGHLCQISFKFSWNRSEFPEVRLFRWAPKYLHKKKFPKPCFRSNKGRDPRSSQNGWDQILAQFCMTLPHLPRL